MNDKLKAFAALVEQHTVARLKEQQLDCAANIAHAKTKVTICKKYTRVDVGASGRYIVENDTQRIFGIKAYGVIHRGHQYGTLDTINDWCWGGYHAKRIEPAVSAPVAGAPHGQKVFETRNNIALYQARNKKFTVVYGLQVSTNLDYLPACTELGSCILHALACDGQVNNE